MCGIFGAVGSFERSYINDVLSSIAHRGPDGSGTADFGNAFLAHTRLAIIDPLPEANQPFLSDDGQIAVVLNGEIYNYKELADKHALPMRTTSDTEALLRLYEKLGDECVQMLDGMFAFGIWDAKRDRLVLARDRAGEKPLFYAKTANGIVFASSVSAILASKLVAPKLNKQALWDFFTFLWIPQPSTVIEGVSALMPGCMMSFDATAGAVVKEFGNAFDAPTQRHELSTFVRKTVRRSITDRLMSDVPVGAFLSGGVDSSIVCAVASESRKDFPTFSVGFKDDYDSYTGYADETKYALAVSESLGTKHTAIMVGARDFEALLDDFVAFADEPFAVVSGLGILAVAKEARRQGIKVLLSGDGADEVFGGYGWHVKVCHSDKTAFSEDKPKGWHYYATESQKHSFLSKDFFDEVHPSTRLLVQEPLSALPKEFLKHDLEFYLKNEMMTKLDRMTMAYGVEGRAAFVSPALLGFADEITYEELLPSDETKPLLKSAFKNDLPQEVLNRPKHGFNPPIDYWMRGAWRGLLDEALSEGSALYKVGIVDHTSILSFKDALNSNENLGNIGFCFLILNMWLQRSGIKDKHEWF